MKRLLIVTALSQELNQVKKSIKNLIIKDFDINYLTIGMGSYNSILNLTKHLENNNYDFIINIGVCGYKDSYENLIQVGRIKNLVNNKELIVPCIFKFAKIASIQSSEVIINNPELLEENFVDMESYGFEKTVSSYNLPRLILKLPVDKVGEETDNFDFKKAEKSLNENIDYEKLFLEIKKYLDENNFDKIDLTKYEDFFKFSFSQRVIFEKLYNKFEVLTGENFEDYFYNYTRELVDVKDWKLQSKNFLVNLEKYLEDK